LRQNRPYEEEQTPTAEMEKESLEEEYSTHFSNKVVSTAFKGFARLKEALLAGDNESEAGTEAYLIRNLKLKV